MSLQASGPDMKQPEEPSRRKFLARLGAGLLGTAAIVGGIRGDTGEKVREAVGKKDERSVKKERPRHRKKERREKIINGAAVAYPSGLKFEIATDEEVLKEWKDAAKLPLQCFRDKFGRTKTEEDIDPETLRYVKENCEKQVPVIKIEPDDLERNISRHFKVKELVRIDTKKSDYMKRKGTWANHEKYMMKDEDGNLCWKFARIDPNLCRVLDLIRDEMGESLYVDEGVRPYAYNLDMYRADPKQGEPVSGSPHTSGKGVDFRCFSETEKNVKFAAAITKVLHGKGGGFGKYKYIYHVDVKIGPSRAGGNWEIGENGKVRLRLRRWP